MNKSYKELVLSIYPKANIRKRECNLLCLDATPRGVGCWRLCDIHIENLTIEEYEEYLWKTAWESIEEHIMYRLIY